MSTKTIIVILGYILVTGGILGMALGRPVNEALLWSIFGVLLMIYSQLIGLDKKQSK